MKEEDKKITEEAIKILQSIELPDEETIRKTKYKQVRHAIEHLKMVLE